MFALLVTPSCYKVDNSKRLSTSCSDETNTLNIKLFGTSCYALTEHSLDILRCSQIHSHNTRNKDTIRLPKVKRNWGKQRINYQAIKDWNDLDSDTRNAPTLVSFKRNLFSKLLT